jgi:hypothetical protein
MDYKVYNTEYLRDVVSNFYQNLSMRIINKMTRKELLDGIKFHNELRNISYLTDFNLTSSHKFSIKMKKIYK